MNAMGKSTSWRKRQARPTFLGRLRRFVVHTRLTWHNLHLGHLVFLGLFLFAAASLLLQVRPFETIAANHTLRINAGKSSGTGNIYNVKIIDKALYDTQPSGTDPNSLTAYGAYGNVTATVSGTNSLYTIGSINDLTTTQFRLVAPLEATANTVYKFFDWQGCSGVEDNYKSDWTPGQDGIAETCVVTYTSEQVAYTRDITARYAAPNQISILTSSSGLAVYQQQNVKVIDKAFLDAQPNGTDPNSLTTYGTYGGLTSNTFFAGNGAYSYIISVPANQRFVSLVFPTYHPGTDSYLFDINGFTGVCATQDNYDANWNKTTNNGGTATPDGRPETCVLDIGDNFRFGGINRIGSNYVEVRYTKNILRVVSGTRYSNNPGVNLSGVKWVEKSYYDTLPSGTNPATLSNLGIIGGITGSTACTGGAYFDCHTDIGIRAGNAYTLRLIPALSQSPSNYQFVGWTENRDGSSYGCDSFEDNYRADWTTGQDGIFETCVKTINDLDGGTQFNTNAVYIPASLRVTTHTNNRFDQNYNTIDSVKIYSKARYDALNPSAGVNPNLMLDTNYGTGGGLTSTTDPTSINTFAGFYYAVTGSSFTTQLLAPTTGTNDPSYTLKEWIGCDSVEDNFNGAWQRTTNNGGTAAPDGVNETCNISYNSSTFRFVRAVYQNNDITITAQVDPTSDGNYLSIDGNRYVDSTTWVNSITGNNGNQSPFSYGGGNSWNTNGIAGNTTNLGTQGFYYTKNVANGTYRVSAYQIAINDPAYTFKEWVGCDSTQDIMNFYGPQNIGPNSNFGPGNTIAPDGIFETCVVTTTGVPRQIFVRYNGQNTVQVSVQTQNPNDLKYLQIDSMRLVDSATWVNNVTGNNGNQNPYNYSDTDPWNTNGIAGNATIAYTNGLGYVKSVPNGTYRISALQNPPNDGEYRFAGWIGCDSTQDIMNFYGPQNIGPNSNFGPGNTIAPDGIFETCVVTSNGASSRSVQLQYNKSIITTRITTTNPTDVNAGWLDNMRFVDTSTWVNNVTGNNGNRNPYNYSDTGPWNTNGIAGNAYTQNLNGYSYTKDVSILNGRISALQTPPNDPGYSFVAWEGCDSTQDVLNFFGPQNLGPNSNFGPGNTATPDGIFETCVMNAGQNVTREVVAKYRRTLVNIYTRTEISSDVNYLGLNDVRIRDLSGIFVGSYGSTNDPNTAFQSCVTWNNQPNPFAGGQYGGCSSTLDPVNGWRYSRSSGAVSFRIAAAYRASSDAEYRFVQWQGCDTVEDNFVDTGNWAAGTDGSFETCVFSKSDGNTYTISALYKRTTLRIYTSTNQPGAPDYNTIDGVRIWDYGNYPNPPGQGWPFDPNARGSCANGNMSNQQGTYGGCTTTADGANGFYYEARDRIINTRLVAPLRATNDTDYVFAGWIGCNGTQDNFNTAWNLGTDGILETCEISVSSGATHTIRAQYRKADTRVRVYTKTNDTNDNNFSQINGVRIWDYGNYPNPPGQGWPFDPNARGSCANGNMSNQQGTYGGCTTTADGANGFYYQTSSLQIDLTGVIRTKLVAPLYATNDGTYTFMEWQGCARTEDNFNTSWNLGTDGIFETCVTDFDNAQINNVNAIYRAPSRINVYTSTSVNYDTAYNTIDGVRIWDYGNYPNPPGQGWPFDPNARGSCANGNMSNQQGTYGGCTTTLDSTFGYRYTQISSVQNPRSEIITKLIAPLTATNDAQWFFFEWRGCNSVEDNFNASWNLGTDGRFETCVVDVRNSNTRDVRAVYTRTQIDVYSTTNNSSDPQYSQISNVRLPDFNTYNASFVGADPNSLTCVQANVNLGDCTKLNSTTTFSSPNHALGKTYTVSPAPSSSYPDTGGVELTDNDFSNSNFNSSGWVGWDTVNPTITIDLGSPQSVGALSATLFRGTPFGIFLPNTITVETSLDNISYTTLINHTTTHSDYLDNSLHNLNLFGSSNVNTRYLRVSMVRGGQWTFVSELRAFAMTTTPNLNGYGFTKTGTTIAGRLVAPLTTLNNPGFTFAGWIGCNSVQDNFDASWQRTTNNGGTATPDGIAETCQFSFANNRPNTLRAQYASASLQVTSRTILATDPNYPTIDNVKIKDIGSGTGAPVTFDPNSYTLLGDLGTYGGITDQPNSNGFFYSRSSSSIATRLIAPLTATNDPTYRFVSWSGCDSTENNYDGSWNAGTDTLNETCVISVASSSFKQVVAQYRREVTDITVIARTLSAADTNYALLNNTKIVSTDIYGAYSQRDPNFFTTATGFGLYGSQTTTSNAQGFRYNRTSPVLTALTTTLVAPLTLPDFPGYGFVSWTGCDSTQDNYTASWTVGTDGVNETCVFNKNDGLSYNLVAQYQRTILNVYTSTINTTDTNYYTIDNVKIVSGDAVGFVENRDGNGQFSRTFTINNNTGSPVTNRITQITFNTALLIAQGKMRPDCGDIRVFDSNNNSLQYNVSNCNSTSTLLQVQVPTLATGITNYTLKFGRLSDTSQSTALTNPSETRTDLTSTTTAPNCTLSGNATWDNTNKWLNANVQTSNNEGGCSYTATADRMLGVNSTFEYQASPGGGGDYGAYYFLVDAPIGQTINNGYFLYFMNWTGFNGCRSVILYRINNTVSTSLATACVPFDWYDGTWRTINVVRTGNTITVTVAGTQYINFNDTNPPATLDNIHFPYGRSGGGLQGVNRFRNYTYQASAAMFTSSLQNPTPLTITDPATSPAGTFGGTTTTDAFPLGYTYQKSAGTIVTTLFPSMIAQNDPEYAFDSWAGCDAVEDNYKADWTIGQDGKAETCYIAQTNGGIDNVRARYKLDVSRIEVSTSTNNTSDVAYNQIDNVKIVSDNAFGTLTRDGNGQFTNTVTFTNTGSAVSNPILTYTFNTQYLIAQGYMRSDCGDIRLFDTNGTTPLDFAVNGCNSSTTQILFKVPSLATANNTFTIKYGKLTDLTVANPNNVYLFNDLNSSTITPLCTPQYAMGAVWDNTNKRLQVNNGASNQSGGCRYNTTTLPQAFEATYELFQNSGGVGTSANLMWGDFAGNNQYYVILGDNPSLLIQQCNSGSCTNVVNQNISGVFNYNAWNSYRVINYGTGFFEIYINGTRYGFYLPNYVQRTPNQLELNSWSGSGGRLAYFRNFSIYGLPPNTITQATTLGAASNDLTATTTTPLCTSVSLASWDNTNKWQNLNPGTAGNAGLCFYSGMSTNNLRTTFEYFATGATSGDSNIFIGGDNPAFGSPNPRPFNSGLQIDFAYNGGLMTVLRRVSDNNVATYAAVNTGLNFRDGTWKNFDVQFSNSILLIKIDGITYVNTFIPNYSPFGDNLAIRSFASSSGFTSRIRNLTYSTATAITTSPSPSTPFNPNAANGTTLPFGAYGGTTTAQSSNAGWFYRATAVGQAIATRLYAPLQATNDPGYVFSSWSGCDSTEDNYNASWAVGNDGRSETCVITSDRVTKQIRAQYTLASSLLTVYSSTNNPIGPDYNTIDNVKFVSSDSFDIPETLNASEYSRPVEVVNNLSTTQTNYQAELVVNTAALITAGKMRSDCGDVRVFSGATQLPYYIQNCNTTNTSIWFKAPTLTVGTNLFSLRYGVLTNTSQEDAVATFEYADLLPSTTTPSCTLTGNASWDNTNKYLDLTTLAANSAGQCGHIYTMQNNGYTAIYDFNTGGGSGGRATFHCAAASNTSAGSCIYFGSLENSGQIYYGTNGFSGSGTNVANLSNSTWRTLRSDFSNGTAAIKLNNTLLLNYTYPAGYNLNNNNWGLFADNNSGTNFHRVRNYLVAKYSPSVVTRLATAPFNPNTANGTSLPFGTYGGTATRTTTSSGWYYTQSFPSTGINTRLVAPINATNDPTYALSGWQGCDSTEDNYTNAWTNGTDGIRETCVINQANSNPRTIRAQYSSNVTLVNVYSRTVSNTDPNFAFIDDVKIVSEDRYLTTALRDPNTLNDGLGYGTYGSRTSTASAQGYFYTRNSFLVNGTNTIATKLVAPLTATNDPTYIFDAWVGCDSTEDNYNATWSTGQDSINETCVISLSNGVSNNIFAQYKRTTLRVVTSTANAANPEYLAVDGVKIIDRSYYTTLGSGTDPNTLTIYGTLGGTTSAIVSDGWQYSYAAGSISGSLVAPLTATNDPTFRFAGWTGCASVQDNYNATWAAGTDGLAETCVFNFANGNVNTVRAIYQPPTRINVNAIRPTGNNNTKVISQAAVTANGGIFNPALAGTGTFTFGAEGGTTNYQYSSYTPITTNLYPEFELTNNEVFTGWTGCTSTQDNYKADWTAGTDSIAETCVTNLNNNQINNITANYRAPATLTVDHTKPLSGNVKVVSQDSFVSNGSAFDPTLAGTGIYTFGTFGGTTTYTRQDGYISTKLYPQLTLSTNEVFDSWIGCDSVENNYGPTWAAVGGDTLNETCVVNLSNATPRTVRAVYKVTTLVVRSSTVVNTDPLYDDIDNVKFVDKAFYDTQPAGTDPNTLSTYGNLGGVTTTYSGAGWFYSRNFATITGRLIAPLTATNDPTYDFRDWQGCDSVEDNYTATWSAGTDGLAETCVVNFTNFNSNTIRARYGKSVIKVMSRTVNVADPNYTLINAVKMVDKAYYDTLPAGTDPNTITTYGTLGATTSTASSTGFFYIYKDYSITGRLIAPLTATNDPNYNFVSWMGCDSVEDNFDASWNTGTDGRFETCVFSYNDGIEHQLVAQYRNVFTNLLVVSKGLSTDPLQFQIDNVKIVDKTEYDLQPAGTDPNTLTSYGTWGDVTATLQSGVGYFYSKQSAPNGSITTRLIAPEQATNDPNHFFSRWIGCDSYEDNFTITWQTQGSPTSVTTGQNSAHETCVINFNNGLSNQITAEYRFIAPASTIRVFTQTINTTDYGYDNVQNVKIGSTGYSGGDPSQYNVSQLGTFGGITTTYVAGQGFYYDRTQKPINTRLYPSMVDPSDNYSFRYWTGCDSTEDNYDRNWVQYPVNTPANQRDGVFETCVIDKDDGQTHDIVARYTATEVRIYSNTLYSDDVNYSNIDNVKIASQGYAGGNPNSLGAAQLGTYGNSTLNFGGPFPQRWYYDVATGSLNTRFYAPLLATNDQTYLFTGWQGCNDTEDNFDANWNAGTDGIDETCVVNRNTQYQITLIATYSQTKIRVFANSYSNTDPRVNGIQGARFGSLGYPGGNPLTLPVSQLGAFGGEANSFAGSAYPYQGYSYTVAATTISTELHASLTAPNNPLDNFDDYNFVEWTGCDSTQDKYDATWTLTTTYGGTANPDGIFETCVIARNNGLINNVAALYSGNLIRVNVSSSGTYWFDPNITGVKLLQIPFAGAAPAISDPNTYAPNTLGTYGGVTSYQINSTLGLQFRIVAPFKATNNTDFEFDSWFSFNSGCSAVEDNYDRFFNAGSDGIFETCVVNLTSAQTRNINARYKQTRLTVATQTLGGLDPDYDNIDNVKILDIASVNPVPSNKDPNAQTVPPLSNLGIYGGVTDFNPSNGTWQYTRGVEGYMTATLLAPLTATNDPNFDFIDWQGCDSTQDNYDGIWNLGTDGRFETCIITRSNGSFNTVTARYSDQTTYLRVHASQENCAPCSITPNLGVIAVRDIGPTGTPSANHNPDSYNPGNLPGLGSFGGVTVNDTSPGGQDYYQRSQSGPGGLVNGTINTRLVAAWQSTTFPEWKFQKWVGCDSTQDNYDRDFNFGITDSIFETCVINRSNGQMNHIHAVYQFNTIEVHTSTPSGFNPDFNAIDNVKILEYGWGNPSLATVVDPNSLSAAQLGKFGGVTSSQYYYSAYNNHDWYYAKGEGYIYQTRLLAPLYATNDPDYGFLEWQGCDSVEDNFNAFWLPGTDGKAETCVVEVLGPGQGRQVVRAVYDDARSILNVQSNANPILIKSPDPDFDNKNTNYTVQKVGINTTLGAPQYVPVSITQTKVFNSWSGCNSTQDNFLADGTTSGQDGIFETCVKSLPDATNATVTALYTTYNYTWGRTDTDQPTIAANATGVTLTSAQFRENGSPITAGTPCENRLQYIEPSLGPLLTYTGTIDNLSRCVTILPSADIPTIGRVEISSRIQDWRGREYLSSDFATNYRFYIVDSGVYTNTLYAYYDASHPDAINGSQIIDLSNRGNTGTNFGATYNTSGTPSWVFDGVGDYIRSNLPSNFSTDVTFDVWYKRSGTQRGALVSQYRFNDSINRLALTNDNDRLSVKIDQNTYSQGSFISDDYWQLGTVTYNTTDNTIAVYANGVLQNTFNVGTLFAPSSSGIDIGKSVLADYFQGQIAEVRLYNSALPESLIRQNFEAQKAQYGFTQPAISIGNLPLSLTFGSHPFSVNAQSGSDSIADATFLDRRALSTAWNATISSTAFSSGTTSVSADNIGVNLNLDPRLMGSPLYVTYGANGNLTGNNVPKTLINVSQFNGSGEYQIDQNLNLTIPGYTPPGNYSATITVTTTSY